MQTTPAIIRPLIGLLAVVAILAGACSADSSEAASVAPEDPSRASTAAELEPSGDIRNAATGADEEWIGGEPDWYDSGAPEEADLAYEAEAPAEYEAMAEEEPAEGPMAEAAPAEEAMTEAAPAEEAMTEAAPAEEAMTEAAPAEGPMAEAAPAEEAMTAAAAAEEAMTEAAAAELTAADTADSASEASGPDGEVAYESELPQATLTGGSIDDNERFEDYLAYRDDFRGLGIPIRDLDPRGRIVVTVTGEGGLPALGAEVVVAGEDVEVSLRTTADGTVRFHPEAYGAGRGPFTVTAGGVSTEATRGERVSIETALPTAASGTVALDVLFLLDATGSMHDEIYQLKITIDEVAQRIHRLPGNVDVRLGMTLYRDEFDSFLTSTFDLTPDVEAFAGALAAVVADGGDDYPEALDEALADALSQPSWRSAAKTIQLVFLVADAPPQVLRDVPVPYTESMLRAAGKGIKIFPVSSSGTDDQAEFVFRQLAQFTGARYVFLTYGAAGRATGSSSDIDQRDYEELSLDDLIVRLVAEELAALAGNPAASQADDDSQGAN